MNEENGAVATSLDELAVEYESPRIFDLGRVLDVTNGSSAGSADSNGQGQY